jgi:hypothetical protein
MLSAIVSFQDFPSRDLLQFSGIKDSASAPETEENRSSTNSGNIDAINLSSTLIFLPTLLDISSALQDL